MSVAARAASARRIRDRVTADLEHAVDEIHELQREPGNNGGGPSARLPHACAYGLAVAVISIAVTPVTRNAP